MDSINARLGHLCQHLTGSDPGRDDVLDVEMILEDAMNLARQKHRASDLAEELEDL